MSQTFSIGQRPYINVMIAGKPVRMLWDSGNDVSLINHQTADYLGISPQHIQQGFSVKGISQEAQQFGMVHLPVTLAGQTTVIPVGVGDVKDNLLGREGVLDKYNVTINSQEVTFSPMGDGLGIGMPIGQNYAYTTQGVCCVSPSNIY